MFLSQLLLNFILEVIAKVRRQKKSMKGIQSAKEEIKLFIEDMITAVSNPKESTTQTPENDNDYGKVVEHMINI